MLQKVSTHSRIEAIETMLPGTRVGSTYIFAVPERNVISKIWSSTNQRRIAIMLQAATMPQTANASIAILYV
ncbi:hypothetical protein PM082_019630 [Marasmius tenuissimus]|nr:hypothetical protein PM082_019630 [Marasmius tenuissimus]